MSVVQSLTDLEASGLTVSVLNGLDRLVPGEWSNVRSLRPLFVQEIGVDKPSVNEQLEARAIALDTQQARYGQALQVYSIVDRVDQAAAGMAVASKVSSLFGSMSFLQKFTPKPETTQAVDAGVKLIAELIAFGLLNGTPMAGDKGIARFVGALEDYAKHDRMRVAGWVVFDGLLPLGPEFVGTLTSTFKGLAGSRLTDNAGFSQLSTYIPGDSIEAKRAFIVDGIDATGGWVERFITEHGLTREAALEQISSALGAASGGADYIAAAIDASTAYFSHTGTQTVARVLARDTVSQVREEVWQTWLDEQ